MICCAAVGVHAVVLGLERGELIGAFLDEGVGAEENLGALLGRQLAPHPGFERLAGPGHRRVDGGLVGIGDLGDLLLGGRVEDRNDPPSCGRVGVDGVTQCA